MEQKRSLAPFGRLRDRLSGLTKRSTSAPSDSAPDADSTESQSPPRNAPVDALTARLVGLEWTLGDDTGVPQLRIEGFAWRRGGVGRGSRVTGVQMTRDTADEDTGSRTVTATLRPVSSAAYNDFSRYPEEDRSDSGFVALLDPSALLPSGDPDEPAQEVWRVTITVADVHGEVTGGFSQRDESGTPGRNNSSAIGGDCLAQTGWGKQGLRVTVVRRALTAERIDLRDGRLEATVRCREFDPTRALLTRGDETRELELVAVDQTPSYQTGRCRVSGSIEGLADGVCRARSWYLQLGDASGALRHVHWHSGAAVAGDDRRPGFRLVDPGDERVAVRYGPNGVIRVDIHARRLVVDAIDLVTGPAGTQQLQLGGECHGLSDDAERWRLIGDLHHIAASALQVAGGRFVATFGLSEVGEWGQRATAVPTDDYVLQVAPIAGEDGVAGGDEEESTSALVAPAYNGPGSTLHSRGNRIRITRTNADRLVLKIGEPRSDGESSGFRHRQFQIMHRTGRIEPTDTIFFDSFDGKNAGDNTRAVYEELLRRHPDLRGVWTVADLSVELPPQVEPVIFKSEAWWRAMTSSRLVVTNCWLPRAFTRRDHQTVLQTWHGTPLKLLGFDRIGTKRGQAYRDRTRREVSQWNMLVSQNPYSTEIFRSAYGYRGEILEIGYPRDDKLSTADDAQRGAIRARLGIAPDETVVLYLPTWREKAKGLFRELDFDAVAAALQQHSSAGGRLLIRGHANTIGFAGEISGPGLLDVTRYPDLAELYLVADVMITDYSSTMFDYSITGKPMIFFAPDIEQYAGSTRGTYFDLTQSAPGPILKSTAAVIEALSDLDAIRSDYAEPYAAWQRKFNPHDDGRASRRAVDALLEAAGEAQDATLGGRPVP